MTDYTLGDTVNFMFTTRRFSTGAPYTLAGTPAVSVYEDNSTTQITSGVTLTTDFDSVTGLNHVAVVATSGNGFEAGKDYHLVITTGTVDSVSVVGEVVGRFTLERSAAAVDLDNATDGLSALKALIDTIDDFLDTEVAAIKAKTDNLPSDPADASDIATAFAAVPTANENADALLDRDMSTGTDSGSTTVRTVRQALRALRNKVSISGSTVTITKEDDSTASWTAALTTDAAADPITAIDPAGP